MTDSDGNEIGKLFIGGLSQATNSTSLTDYFQRFGEIEDAVVMMDNKTGRSRGFGYVKYTSPDSIPHALQVKPHLIDGKEVDAKQCNINMKGRNRRSLKVFVGGIGLDQDAESLSSFFQQFGHVTDVNLMLDVNKQRHRGFAFVGFDDETVVKKLIGMHYITMSNNKQVEIKAMEPPNFGRRHNMLQNNSHSGKYMNSINNESFYAPSNVNCSNQYALPQSLHHQFDYGSQNFDYSSTFNSSSANSSAYCSPYSYNFGPHLMPNGQPVFYPSFVNQLPSMTTPNHETYPPLDPVAESYYFINSRQPQQDQISPPVQCIYPVVQQLTPGTSKPAYPVMLNQAPPCPTLASSNDVHPLKPLPQLSQQTPISQPVNAGIPSNMLGPLPYQWISPLTTQYSPVSPQWYNPLVPANQAFVSSQPIPIPPNFITPYISSAGNCESNSVRPSPSQPLIAAPLHATELTHNDHESQPKLAEDVCATYQQPVISDATTNGADSEQVQAGMNCIMPGQRPMNWLYYYYPNAPLMPRYNQASQVQVVCPALDPTLSQQNPSSIVQIIADEVKLTTNTVPSKASGDTCDDSSAPTSEEPTGDEDIVRVGIETKEVRINFETNKEIARNGLESLDEDTIRLEHQRPRYAAAAGGDTGGSQRPESTVKREKPATTNQHRGEKPVILDQKSAQPTNIPVESDFSPVYDSNNTNSAPSSTPSSGYKTVYIEKRPPPRNNYTKNSAVVQWSYSANRSSTACTQSVPVKSSSTGSSGRTPKVNSNNDGRGNRSQRTLGKPQQSRHADTGFSVATGAAGDFQ